MFKPDSYALVPGCGSGYDPILLGTANENSSSPYFANVIGLDLSKTAIDVCESNLKAHMSGSEGASLKGNVSFSACSFFDYKCIVPVKNLKEVDGEMKFDFIFDYLFFAALEYHSEQTQWEGGATMRGRWAQSMRRLLRPESGLLATLVFPTRPGQEGLPAKAEGDTGPPFTVTLGSYAEVLVPLGFECIAAAPVPEQASIKPRRGREVMAYWKLHPE